MNLTIPIRAQNSKRSWTRGVQGKHTRYIFSITTALLLVSTLIMGSVSGLVQGVSAKDNFNRSNYYNMNTSGRGGNSGSSNQSTTKNTQNTSPSTTKSPPPAKSTTPARQTTTTTPPKAATPAPATTTPPAPAPAAQKSAPQPAPEPTTPAPVDTTPAINAMTAAQSAKPVQPVTYTSQKISNETRNRIFILAGIAAVTGGLLYTISFIGATAPAMKREIPIRYIVPIREGITS